MRFPLEVFEAVRAAWPEERPLGVRFNGTDWTEGGITPDEAVRYASELARRGCDYVDVSSGGNCFATIPNGPGYQVPFAARVKNEVGMPTMAVGLIRAAQHAEAIVRGGQADMVAIGRGILNDPRWPWHAAEALGGEKFKSLRNTCAPRSASTSPTGPGSKTAQSGSIGALAVPLHIVLPLRRGCPKVAHSFARPSGSSLADRLTEAASAVKMISTLKPQPAEPRPQKSWAGSQSDSDGNMARRSTRMMSIVTNGMIASMTRET